MVSLWPVMLLRPMILLGAYPWQWERERWQAHRPTGGRSLTGGRLALVTDEAASAKPDSNRTDAAPEPSAELDLESLVGDWLTVPDIAEKLGIPLSQVRQMITDREVLSARVGERHVVAVPAKFFDEGGVRTELRGTFTVLADGGMSDEEILRWLFTPDDTLPVEGAPMDALRAGHKTEIRRRAQALAF